MVVVAAVTVAPAGAYAQERDPAAGEALFLEGRRLMKAGDVAAACAKLAESERLDPAVGTLANLADCEEQLGRTASAWQHWREAADRMPAGDPRRVMAGARAAALEKRLARLSVNLAPGASRDVVVFRDGVRLGEASYGLYLPIDPGAHVVELRAGDGRRLRRMLAIGVQEKWEVVLDLNQAAAVTPAADGRMTVTSAPISPPALSASMVSASPVSVSPSTAGAEPPASGGAYLKAAATVPTTLQVAATPEPFWSTRSPRLAWGLVAVGASAAATGAALGWQALRMRDVARSRCAMVAGGDNPGCWRSARSALDLDRQYSLGADLAFATSAVATGAGIYLLFRSRKQGSGSSQEPRGPTLMAAPRTGGGEVQVAGSF